MSTPKRTMYPNCPNESCPYNKAAPPRWYWKYGTFTTKWNEEPVTRYRCKNCKGTFSSHTFQATYQQKKPYLNDALMRLMAECPSERGLGRGLECSLSTVDRKLRFLGLEAKRAIDKAAQLPENKTSYVQFDEMFSFEKSKCLPLTISLAVRPKTQTIIAARVGSIPCDTRLKKRSLAKFGHRENQKEETVRQMLRDLKCFVRDEDNFTIASDKWREYRGWVKDELPFANHQTHLGENLKRRVRAMASADLNAELYDFSDEPLEEPLWIKKFQNGKTVVKAYDPLFAVNQKCMRLRTSVSRLRNDFWGYTQKVENLQYHLWIVIAVMNGWKLPKWK